MTYRLVIASGVVSAGLALRLAVHAADAPKTEILFDGTSLDAFDRLGKPDWTVTDGIVEAKNGERGYLVTKASYGDYKLTLEFWTSPEANSGVFLRCENPAEVNDTSCYEVNIFDQRPDQTYRTGAITNIAAPKAKIDAGGKWNSYEITVRGNHLTVKLNGTVTVDIEDASHAAPGRIALQYAGGIVRFRNVKLTALD